MSEDLPYPVKPYFRHAAEQMSTLLLPVIFTMGLCTAYVHPGAPQCAAQSEPLGVELSGERDAVAVDSGAWPSES
jgi:hypothetical protein